MKEMSCGRVCSPNALLFLQEELQPVVSSTTVTGPSSLLYFYQTLLSLSSPEGTEFGYEAKKSTGSKLPCICPTDTSVCVCVHEGGQSTMFAFLPGVGTLPLPAASRGQARCARRTRWTKHRREGGWSGEQGIVAFFCGDSALKAVLQIWLRGNLCPPHLYPDPDSDPSLSQLSILSQECPKAAEYQYLRLTGMSSKKK